jgi:hypothetical protein
MKLSAIDEEIGASALREPSRPLTSPNDPFINVDDMEVFSMP